MIVTKAENITLFSKIFTLKMMKTVNISTSLNVKMVNVKLKCVQNGHNVQKPWVHFQAICVPTEFAFLVRSFALYWIINVLFIGL